MKYESHEYYFFVVAENLMDKYTRYANTREQANKLIESFKNELSIEEIRLYRVYKNETNTRMLEKHSKCKDKWKKEKISLKF